MFFTAAFVHELHHNVTQKSTKNVSLAYGTLILRVAWRAIAVAGWGIAVAGRRVAGLVVIFISIQRVAAVVHLEMPIANAEVVVKASPLGASEGVCPSVRLANVEDLAVLAGISIESRLLPSTLKATIVVAIAFRAVITGTFFISVALFVVPIVGLVIIIAGRTVTRCAVAIAATVAVISVTSLAGRGHRSRLIGGLVRCGGTRVVLTGRGRDVVGTCFC